MKKKMNKNLIIKNLYFSIENNNDIILNQLFNIQIFTDCRIYSK